MKIIRKLNIKDWSYFFEQMVNILDIDPGCFGTNDTKQCTDGTINKIFVIMIKLVYHILFLIILIVIFKKMNGILLYFFCDNIKNKNIVDIYF